MELIIQRSILPGIPTTFSARCLLELHSSERDQLIKYGAPPLTMVKPLHPRDLPVVPLQAFFGEKELTDLVSPDGFVYSSTDVRMVELFIGRLAEACAEIKPYWAEAVAFSTKHDGPFKFE